MTPFSIVDIARRIGDRLELEPGTDTDTWTRFPLLRRLRAIIAADIHLAAAVDQFANNAGHWLALLRTHNPDRVFETTLDAETASAEYRSYLLAAAPQRVFVAATAYDKPVEILEQHEVDRLRRNPMAAPSIAKPVAVLRDDEIRLYAGRSGPQLEVTWVKGSPWHCNSYGTVTNPGGNWFRMTVADSETPWTTNEWVSAYCAIDAALLTAEQLATTGYDGGNVNGSSTFDFEQSGFTEGTYPFQLVKPFASISNPYAEALAVFAALALASEDDGVADTSKLNAEAERALAPILTHRSRA